MSAGATTRPAGGPPRERPGDVTLGRVVRSERIKLLTLRSTWWTLVLAVVGMALVALLPATLFAVQGDGPSSGPGPVLGGPDVGALTVGSVVAQVLVTVLGVLAVTNEYSSGMVRATMTAVPRRVPVLLAKAVVLAVAAVVVGVLGALLSWLVTLPLYGTEAPALTSPTAWRVVLGTGLLLAGSALLALGVGTLLRSAAGAVAVVLGVLLVLPGALGVVAITSGSEALARVVPYLPGEAGAVVTQVAPGGPLGPWAGLGVMALWVLAVGAAAALLLRRRDV